MEREKRVREKREEDERAAKRQRNIEGSSPLGSPQQQQNDGPSVLSDGKFCLERVKYLTCPADDQILGDTDGQRDVAAQRDQLLTAQEKHVAENRRLSGELGFVKTAVLKAEGERNEALRKVGILEKVVESEKAKVSKAQKEKEELERTNAELAEKLKDARR